ncbi:MAG TPA: PIN domain-containing protein [Armatimonadota bacterium]|jgi:hypothetical protein
MSKVFLDTSYAIALSVPKDPHHARARVLATELSGLPSQMVTTTAVLLEIGDGLAGFGYRNAALVLIDALQGDPDVQIISLTTSLFNRALDLYRSRPDKEWGPYGLRLVRGDAGYGHYGRSRRRPPFRTGWVQRVVA